MNSISFKIEYGRLEYIYSFIRRYRLHTYMYLLLCELPFTEPFLFLIKKTINKHHTLNTFVLNSPVKK